jgi:hypothetical protein
MPEKDIMACRRFESGTTPCPNINDEDFLAWRSMTSGGAKLLGEVTERIKKKCAECEVFLPLPEGQI